MFHNYGMYVFTYIYTRINLYSCVLSLKITSVANLHNSNSCISIIITNKFLKYYYSLDCTKTYPLLLFNSDRPHRAVESKPSLAIFNSDYYRHEKKMAMIVKI